MWDDEQRLLVFGYLQRGLFARGFLGWSKCRICGRPVGSEEWTDGMYIWPEGLSHYVGDHKVRLPEEFVRHAERNLAAFNECDIDVEWWIDRTQPHRRIP
jgi:hypothetical protein